MDLLLAKVQGIDAAIDGNNLTALVFPGSSSAGIAAKAGYPTVIVPAGYLSTSSPYGIGFTGNAYSEATLVSLAYSYEQATKVRQPPGSALRLLPVSTQILPSQVVNYASGATGSVAPGEMVAITGIGIGPSQTASLKITANSHIDTSAGTTRVLFDGIPAPIVSSQATQIVAIVPYGVSGKTSSKMTVEYNGQVSAPMTVPITDVAPAIFTDQRLGKGSPWLSMWRAWLHYQPSESGAKRVQHRLFRDRGRTREHDREYLANRWKACGSPAADSGCAGNRVGKQPERERALRRRFARKRRNHAGERAVGCQCALGRAAAYRPSRRKE